MKILLLPPEIIAQILSYLEYDSVKTVILTCPTTLYTKLLTSGHMRVLSKVEGPSYEKICSNGYPSYRDPLVSLISPPSTNSSRKFPNLSKPLFSKLSSLTIAVSYPFSGMTVDLMPVTLTHLCWYAPNSPFLADPSQGQAIKEALPLLKHLDFKCSPFSEIPRKSFLSQLPYDLESLTYSSNQPNFLFFQLLPKSLRMFSFYYSQDGHTGPGIVLSDTHYRAHIPVSVTDLRLAQFRISSRQGGKWSFPLPSLLRLRVASVDTIDLQSLPSTITSLEFTTRDSYSYERCQPVDATAWPLSLTSFTCTSSGTPLIVSGAPHSLSQLHITGQRYAPIDSAGLGLIKPWSSFSLEQQAMPWLRILRLPDLDFTETGLRGLPSMLAQVTIRGVILDGSSIAPGTTEISSIDHLWAMFQRTSFPFTLMCLYPDTAVDISPRFILPEGLEILTLPNHSASLLDLPPSIIKATSVKERTLQSSFLFPQHLTHLEFKSKNLGLPSNCLLSPNKLKYLKNVQISLKGLNQLGHTSDATSTSSVTFLGLGASSPVIPHLNVPGDALESFQTQISHIELRDITYDTSRLLETLTEFPPILKATFKGKFYIPPLLAQKGFPAPLEVLDLSEGALMNATLEETVLPSLPDTLTELHLSGTPASRLLHPIQSIEQTEKWLPKRLRKLVLLTQAPGAGYSSHEFELPFMPYLTSLHITACYISPKHVKSIPAYLDIITLSKDSTTLSAVSSGAVHPVRPEKRSDSTLLAQQTSQSSSLWPTTCTIS